MPTYEYKCEACEATFEKFQSITASPIRKCPQCGKNRVRRIISAGAGLIFKGSGFYITDYRSEGYKSAAKNDGGPATPAPASTSDSKPAAPAASTSPDPVAASKPQASSTEGKKPAATKA
jgi:putative FmdB family regulatory protein